MGPVNDLPAVARARSRKEKNKLASRYDQSAPGDPSPGRFLVDPAELCGPGLMYGVLTVDLVVLLPGDTEKRVLCWYGVMEYSRSSSFYLSGNTGILPALGVTFQRTAL